MHVHPVNLGVQSTQEYLMESVADFDSNFLPLEAQLPQYLIERNVPGAGKLTSDELKAISQKSCSVLNQLGP